MDNATKRILRVVLLACLTTLCFVGGHQAYQVQKFRSVLARQTTHQSDGQQFVWVEWKRGGVTTDAMPGIWEIVRGSRPVTLLWHHVLLRRGCFR